MQNTTDASGRVILSSSSVSKPPKRKPHYNTLKTQCSNGHDLVGANLRPDKLRTTGQRICLACSYASAIIANRRSRGLSIPDFQTLADEKFDAIMGAGYKC